MVVRYCAWLGEWTGAQVLATAGQTVEVVDLDWSSPVEPRSVAELGELVPLMDPRGRHDRARPAQLNVPRELPRSFTVLGAAAQLDLPRCHSYGSWSLTCGFLLDEARRQRAGASQWPWLVRCDHADLDHRVGSGRRDDILALHLFRVGETDCAEIAGRFPKLVQLVLAGCGDQFQPYSGPDHGVLRNVSALNGLHDLEVLRFEHVYGMTAADLPQPDSLRRLDSLTMTGIPADFAQAVRSAWRPLVKSGVALSVRQARSKEWLAEHVRTA